MSTGAKRPLADAKANAAAFACLFAFHPVSTFARWEIAGSIRRACEFVGDCEHVVIPAFGNVGEGLYADTNLLWHRLDALVADGTVTKHVRADGRECWGDKQRTVIFRGIQHDIFTADTDNWGNILAIRTGPWEFSRRLVTVMKARGFRQQDGYLWRGWERISVPDEEKFFRCCGIAWTPPEQRGVEVVAR